jgi:hypothetical protein
MEERARTTCQQMDLGEWLGSIGLPGLSLPDAAIVVLPVPRPDGGREDPRGALCYYRDAAALAQFARAAGAEVAEAVPFAGAAILDQKSHDLHLEWVVVAARAAGAVWPILQAFLARRRPPAQASLRVAVLEEDGRRVRVLSYEGPVGQCADLARLLLHEGNGDGDA